MNEERLKELIKESVKHTLKGEMVSNEDIQKLSPSIRKLINDFKLSDYDLQKHFGHKK